MSDSYIFFALGAALSWTIAGVLGYRPSRELGSLHFNRLRMLTSVVMVGIYILITGGSVSLGNSDMLLVLLSGVIGVAMGDYFLFKAMQRLGPRRTGILFAANAPMTALLGLVFLGEFLSLREVIAIAIGFVGIVLAIIYGKRRDLAHVWENITPPLWLGVVYGLLAALGQSFGVLLVRPVMESGADPIAVVFFRVLIATAVLWAIFPVARLKAKDKPIIFIPPRLYLYILGNGFFGITFGVVLLLKALETGPVAAVSILSATSPLMILPFIWATTRLTPPLGAWIGAALVVLCSTLLV